MRDLHSPFSSYPPLDNIELLPVAGTRKVIVRRPGCMPSKPMWRCEAQERLRDVAQVKISGRCWTSEQDQIIRDHHAEGVAAIAALLPLRTPEAIEKRIRTLGLARRTLIKWSAVDDARLHAGERVFNRSRDAVERHGRKIGAIKRSTAPKWTAEMLATLAGPEGRERCRGLGFTDEQNRRRFYSNTAAARRAAASEAAKIEQDLAIYAFVNRRIREPWLREVMRNALLVRVVADGETLDDAFRAAMRDEFGDRLKFSSLDESVGEGAMTRGDLIPSDAWHL